RKLYHTEARQYITLEGIAGLIRQGQEVQVVDHATGEDLTAIVLTQIIAEQERKRTGFLPQAVLTGLIRSGGETLATLQRTLTASIELLYQADEEVENRIHALGGHYLERRLRERGVPTRDDLQQVVAQLEALSEKLDNLTRS
ncbi:MAG: pesticidal protein Cry15Aa, partial [Anaerolineae bacterium]|nr:pesticidal protein Cry15Aa [Anaerolineae bacterium]